MQKKHVLIIANGSVPSLEIIFDILTESKFIVCADGGANIAKQLKITPNVILGDFDSILSTTRRYFEDIPQIHLPDQHATDLEKAILFCIEENFSSVTIIGATGDRIDHTTGSLGCFKKFGKKISMKLIDGIGEISLLQKSTLLTTQKGEKLSLIPLERCEGVTTSNLKYELHNNILELGVCDGISNEAIGKRAIVSVKKGTLLLYRFHNASQ